MRIPSWWQFAIKQSKLQAKQEAARKDQQLKFKKKALCTAVNPIQVNWPRPPNKSEKATRDFCGMTYLVNLGSVNSVNGSAVEVNKILFDTGANCCISNNRNNFVGTFTPMECGAVDGIGKGLTIAGKRQVAWTFRGDNGMYRTLKLLCYHTPSSNTRIASVGVVLKTYPSENINITQDSLVLSGNSFEQQPSITVAYCPRTQLLFAVAEIKPGNEFNDVKPEVYTRKLKSSQQLKPIGSLTDSDNYNLSQPEKELL